jgi:hypothetical protein
MCQPTGTTNGLHPRTYSMALQGFKTLPERLRVYIKFLFKIFPKYMLSAMSSKHQPNPRKRPIDQVTPEFPCLPIISMPATVEFAYKSQKALESVGISPNATSLFLPLISPHKLQQRFCVGDDDSVFVVMRNAYSKLKDELDNLNYRKYSGIYVRGPVGVGKSYLLYILAAQYHLDRKTYRVTYINDCKAWRPDRYGYLLKELVMTFYNDSIDGKSIVEWCEAVVGSEKEEKMMMMMEALINYIHAKKFHWVVICDQHNALYNPFVVKDFPFIIIDYLSNNCGTNIKVVISASANNEGYPTEMKGWHTHDISSHRFVDSEFKEWCEHYLLKDNKKVNHESEEAVDALYLTGGVPYELDLLWKQPSESLHGKTLFYRKERVRDMSSSHGKFYKTLVDKERMNLEECISRMALGLSPPEILVGMDRQLFDIVLDDDNEQVINALNPIARRALLGYHGVGLITSLRFVAELVLKGIDYTNSMKGKISEMYITTILELSLRFSFPIRKIANINTDTLKMQNIEIKAVIHFSSNKLPPKSSFKSTVTTLFVPDSPNYPRFDFFLWDSERQILMGFQVTVRKPFINHPKMSNAQEWQRFCFGNSKQTVMELYWIVPKRCIGADFESVKEDYVVFFEDLANDFPALLKLVLQ